MLQGRRILSTTDCLAYEERDSYFYNESGTIYVLSGSRVYPYVVDINKLNDLKHFNCMRKDFYDSLSDAQQGINDSSIGSGKSAKYEIAVFDLQTDQFVYGATDASKLFSPANREGSKVGNLGKTIGECSAAANNWWQFWNPFYWMTMPGGLICKAKFGYNYECVADACWETDIYGNYVIDAKGDNVIRYLVYIDQPVTYNLTTYDSTLNCTNKTAVNSIFPIMLKTDTELHPAIIFLKTCSVEGANYKGIPFCEKSFKIGGFEGCE